MIIIIELNAGKGDYRNSVVNAWRFGDEISKSAKMKADQKMNKNVSNIVLYADGEELNWIRENITGIPHNKKDTCQWIGNDAMFIYWSLPKQQIGELTENCNSPI